jgi:nicotinate phosphoribosyltransferase
MQPPLFMPGSTGLQTEVYQLVQSAVYHADGLWGEATFDLYVKDLPADWGYLIAAGIDPAVDAVLALRFSEAELRWLADQPAFSRVNRTFIESLGHLRFTGDILAVPEGTVVFPGEPILRVTAPLPQVGLVEARLVQLLTLTSGVATRATRLVAAAQGRPILDFGTRRCAGAEAAFHAARGAWIGGATATTNALASSVLGLPAWHVMSDAMLAAYDEPRAAYEAFYQYFPDATHVNLPGDDPNDGVAALRALPRVHTVRLDHRELGPAAQSLRRSLDRYGLKTTRILGSGSLDEHRIAELLRAGAPIDLFGVGSALAAGGDQARPNLSYRIAELVRGYEPSPVTSTWSAPWPGRKQLYRFAHHDELGLETEAPAQALRGGEALLRPVVTEGQRVVAPESLTAARERVTRGLNALPGATRSLRAPSARTVRITDALREMALRR